MATSPFSRFLTALLLVLFSCAFAREGAFAQFSEPYDPEFSRQEPAPEEAPAREAPTPSPAERPPEEVPEWVRAAGPFLLFERPDPARFFEAPPATAAARSLQEFLRDFKPFETDTRRWNTMRQDYERGTLPTEELIAPEVIPMQPELIAVSSSMPRPPPPEIELPTYGTSLSITGRKLIGFAFSEKRFLRDQPSTSRPKSTNLIDITQQLQLRMQGKVGPKITVNVDYDDTKTNKQDISVVYSGDPNEVVQNASFGDIDLSLPATEFVSYNKQLFGIRVNLKYKGFSAIFIGSRTKGQTKTKQFRGNSQFTNVDILDTSYIRRRYYDLTFNNSARLPIRSGSERVFLSRQAGALPNINDVTLTVDDLTNVNSSFTGVFTQLSPGLDYTVDYVKGILTFRNSLDANAVVAVDFVDAGATSITVQTSSTSVSTSGGSGRLKLIKTFADIPIISSTTEAGFDREMKTFYGIGRSQIIRDDGRGNFFLKVLDQARNEVGPLLNPVQKYPDTIEVDFENGIFRLLRPFGVSVSSPQPDPEIYAPAPLTKRLFQVEFRFRLKTFFLEPSLVLQSEVVLLDNVRLQRNVDYFIDYESGFITFFNEERIRTDSVIDISYEVAPFTGSTAESILGTRVSHDFNSHFSLGSTLLYQAGSKPPTVPSI
ncbi:MAG: hypothetical protein HYZ74_07460, partial [Elusimicrobia bacterium]|nr:hypothetical protein [Elusimicrobiota bacterium]